MTLEQLVNAHGSTRTYFNPSAIYGKIGQYMPRLTMYKRPTRVGIVYQLAVEFSAPKLLFGNNFDELTENDFDQLLTVLQEKLYELLGYRFFRPVLAKADIGAWHPSKNVVFLDGTASQTILHTLNKLDVSRVYDLQKATFIDGQVLHIHCNSIDIAFYDKMADLRKAKVSPKRSFEQDSLVQLDMLQQLDEFRPLEVFRYEVRFIGKKAVKRAYPELTEWTFENLFKEQKCRDTLLKHWKIITSSVSMIALDTNKPYELLQNYLLENPDVTPQTALAAVAGLLICGQESTAGLRNLIEATYGRQAWYRLKPILKSPNKNRFKHFVHVQETLEQFTPISMSQFATNLEYTVN